MSDNYPLSLAFFDFLPVIAFAIGAIFLVRLSMMVCGRRCAFLSLTGSLLITLGGFLQACWKLMFISGVGDLRLMREVQFLLSAPGFVMLLIVAILLSRSNKTGLQPGLMVMAAWKIPFLAVMTLASMGMNGILAHLSFQRRETLAAVGFIISFLCLVGLGAMASGEQTLERQWTEEIVNSLGQISFAFGCFLLYRNFWRDG